jgi:1-acyl-sn-glycerol-3-phosphate acyltransferase
MSSWRRPGVSGRVIYAVLAAVFGVGTAVVSRLVVERRHTQEELVEDLPPGGIIVISNHTSYADAVFLALAGRSLGRSLRLLGTAGIVDAPVLKTLLRRIGFISVKRGHADASDALEPAAEALRAGEAVALYPEGRLTRDPNGWPEQAKTGAVRLAFMTDAPIVPIASIGATDVLGRRARLAALVRNIWHRPEVRMKVGASIDVRVLSGLGVGVDPTTEQVRATSDQVMAALIVLVGELRGESSPHPTGAARASIPNIAKE